MKRLLISALWLLLLVVLFSLIWFGGPELRFGETRPLEPIGWRLGFLGLIAFILFGPFFLRLYTFINNKIKVELTTQSVENSNLSACKTFLSILQKKIGYRRGFFSPDFILFLEDSLIDDVVSSWPSTVVWSISHENAGLAFMSEGQVYLVPNNADWSYWAKLLRFRRSPRALLTFIHASTASNRDALKHLVADLSMCLQIWRKSNFRTLPVWTSILQTNSPFDTCAWFEEASFAPWGFSLPNKVFSSATFFENSSNWIQVFDFAISNPLATSSDIHYLLKTKENVKVQFANLRHFFDEFFVSTLDNRFLLRGVFCLWSGRRSIHGLNGFNTILNTDRGRASFVPIPQIIFIFISVFLILFSSIYLYGQSYERIYRNHSATDYFINNINSIKSNANIPSSVDTPSELVINLDQFDNFTYNLNNILIEQVPMNVILLVNDYRSNYFNTLGLQFFYNKLQFFSKNHSNFPYLRYRMIAFIKMLHDPAHADHDLMHSLLRDLDFTPEEASSLIRHWKSSNIRRQNAYEEKLTKHFVETIRSDYSFELMVWDAIQHQLRPISAFDFSLEHYLGPNAAWFSNAENVPWIFTHEGAIRGFIRSRDYYSTWHKQYNWVIGVSNIPFALDDVDSLFSRLKSNYIRDASLAWNMWFDNLHLLPVSDVAASADRIQYFASDASPVMALLNVLQAHMPLPPSGNGGFIDRIKRRLTEDWAKIQYAFGWTTSPRPQLNRSDPRVSIGQNFALLQSYFSAGGKPSPNIIHFQSGLNALSDVLNKLNASEQMGTRSPPEAAIKKIRSRALRLPPPLRQLMLELSESSQKMGKLSNAEVRAEAMFEVGSFSRCLKKAIFPFNLTVQDELPWSLFVEEFGYNGLIQQVNRSFGKDPEFQFYRRNSNATRLAQPFSDIYWLHKAHAISKSWFSSPNTQSSSLRVSVVDMSPSIKTFRLLVGDEIFINYSHGRVFENVLFWPPVSIPKIQMQILADSEETLESSFFGPWSLLRFAVSSDQSHGDNNSTIFLNYKNSFGYVTLKIISDSDHNPLDARLYEGMCVK